jgi:hypothetical protein
MQGCNVSAFLSVLVCCLLVARTVNAQGKVVNSVSLLFQVSIARLLRPHIQRCAPTAMEPWKYTLSRHLAVLKLKVTTVSGCRHHGAWLPYPASMAHSTWSHA